MYLVRNSIIVTADCRWRSEEENCLRPPIRKDEIFPQRTYHVFFRGNSLSHLELRSFPVTLIPSEEVPNRVRLTVTVERLHNIYGL